MIYYWQGFMNWPLDENWKCEICGSRRLTWGLVHAQCRCDVCHTQYRMREKEGKVVTIPICQLKPEYCIPAKLGWSKLKKPVDELSDSEWDSLLEEAKNDN